MNRLTVKKPKSIDLWNCLYTVSQRIPDEDFWSPRSLKAWGISLSEEKFKICSSLGEDSHQVSMFEKVTEIQHRKWVIHIWDNSIKVQNCQYRIDLALLIERELKCEIRKWTFLHLSEINSIQGFTESQCCIISYVELIFCKKWIIELQL